MITNINEFKKSLNENRIVGGHFSITENGDLKISIDGIEADVLAEMKLYQGDDEQFLWEFFESELTNGYSLVSSQYKGLTEAPMISDSIIDDETDSTEINNGTIKIWAFMDYQVVSVKDELLKNGFVIFKNDDYGKTNESFEIFKNDNYGKTNENRDAVWQKWMSEKIYPAESQIKENTKLIVDITAKLITDLELKKSYTTDVLSINSQLQQILDSFQDMIL